MKQTPYSIPEEPGRWRAAALAVAVHLALLAFLWIGINWQSATPVAVEAELWSPQTRDAAPTPPPPPPQPQPKPQPQVTPPPQAQPVEPPKNVDIALQQEKKRKEEQLKQQQAAAEQARQEKLKEQAEQARKEQQQKLAEQKKAEAEKQAALEKKRKQDAAYAKLQKEMRQEEMQRLTSAVGSGGSGQAAKSQGNGRADAGYTQKVAAKIRSNTVFSVPENLNGNPAVQYDVELLPDGSVRSIELAKSSGLPGFDEAVRRAILASQPFPPDNSGHVPSGFTVIHKPKDQ